MGPALPRCMGWSLKCNADHSPPHRMAVGLFGTGHTQNFRTSQETTAFLWAAGFTQEKEPQTTVTMISHDPECFLASCMGPQSSSGQKHTLPIPGITRGLDFFPFHETLFQTVTVSFLTHFPTHPSHPVHPILTGGFSCSLAPRTATSILAV